MESKEDIVLEDIGSKLQTIKAELSWGEACAIFSEIIALVESLPDSVQSGVWAKVSYDLLAKGNHEMQQNDGRGVVPAHSH